MPLDRDTFIRPIAHRGLHNAKKGIVENTMAAFEAAIAKGYGIECDVRPIGGGVPVVFHDETLDRLIDHKGKLENQTAASLKRMRHKIGGATIASFDDALDLVGWRVPLLVEIKSEWTPPNREFLAALARSSAAYRGPIAFMSFDPAVMTAMRELAPRIPRGIVSGSYKGAGWWNRKISRTRAAALRDLLESGLAAPDFYAYQVSALPTPVTRYVREVLGLPLFTWTVRSKADRVRAGQWADAPIFEGFEP